MGEVSERTAEKSAVKMMDVLQKPIVFLFLDISDFFHTNERGQYESITSQIRSSGTNKYGRDDRIHQNLNFDRSSNASSSSLSRSMNSRKRQRESPRDIKKNDI